MTAHARDSEVYLDDITESIAKIEEYLDGITKENFCSSSKDQDAILRRLIVIGEAANRLSPLMQERIAAPWRVIVDMRNFVIHDYSNITPDVVWKTATRDIPLLKIAIQTFRLQQVNNK